MNSSIIIKRYILGYKSRTIFLVSVITLSIVFFCSTGIIITSIITNEARIRNEKYGVFDYLVIGVTPKGEEMAKAHAYIDNTGWICTVGYVPVNRGAYIGCMDSDAVNMARIKTIDGRLPEKDGEIAFEISTLQKLGVKVNVGDKVSLSIAELYSKQNIAAKSLQEEFIVAGILDEFVCIGGYEQQIGIGDTGSFPGIIIPVDTVKRYNAEGFPSQKSLLYSLKKGISEKEAKDKIRIEGKYGYLNIENNKLFERINWKSEDSNSIITGITAMGLVAVFMAFVIINSFFISITERQRHFGVLRGVGATSKQIRDMVLGEAMIIAALSIPLGVLISIAVSHIALVSVENFTKGSQISVIVSPYIMISAIAISLISVVCAALVPAIKASRLMPVKAMSPNNIVIKDRDILWSSKPKDIGSGGMPLIKEKKVLVKIAIKNIGRNKSRAFMVTMMMAMSMAVFMFVFTAVSVFYKNIESNRFTGGNTYDIRLRQTVVNPKTAESGMTGEQIQMIQNMEGVGRVDAYKILRYSLCGIPKEKITSQMQKSDLVKYNLQSDITALFQKAAGKDFQLLNIDIVGITSEKMEQLGGKNAGGKFLLYSPDFSGTEFNTGDEILVLTLNPWEDAVPERRKIKLSHVISKLPEEIVADRGNSGATIFVDEKSYEALSKDCLFNDIYVYASKDAKLPALERELRVLAGESDNLTVDALWETMGKYRDDYEKGRLAGYTLCFVIAILSVCMYLNSMYAAVLARKNEFALMRAVGMAKSQLSWIIGAETAIYSIISSLLSIFICLLPVSCVVKSEGYSFITDIRWGAFMLVFAVNVTVGQLAAGWPLRKLFSNQIIHPMKHTEF